MDRRPTHPLIPVDYAVDVRSIVGGIVGGDVSDDRVGQASFEASLEAVATKASEARGRAQQRLEVRSTLPELNTNGLLRTLLAVAQYHEWIGDNCHASFVCLCVLSWC